MLVFEHTTRLLGPRYFPTQNKNVGSVNCEISNNTLVVLVC